MLYTLKSNALTVTLSSKGAEIVSVKNATGCEYVWQGDPAYWSSHAPLLLLTLFKRLRTSPAEIVLPASSLPTEEMITSSTFFRSRSI